jgi:hypothetical protein
MFTWMMTGYTPPQGPQTAISLAGFTYRHAIVTRNPVR